MRLIGLALPLFAALVCAQDEAVTVPFQSDISRLMSVVVSHLYHHKDVFLRELTSNAGDAISKTRILALTDPSILDAAPALNISIRPHKESRTLVIADSGVGMTREELQKNLGTIARSGTSEFLTKMESGGEKSSNLIGQFGLGFYSSFLVADRVQVASKSKDDDTQWVFESKADASEFTVKKDPRGNTLGRGTEITLHLKDDASEYLQEETLKNLINKHSTFSTTAPIYLWSEQSAKPSTPLTDEDKPEEDKSEDETAEEEVKEVQTGGWQHINDQPPIWMRDSKTVSDEDYISFYQSHFKESEPPLFWSHIKGDAGSTSFRALIYMPANIPNDIFAKNYVDLDAIRLYVRRVYITSDLGPNYIPKWLQYMKVIVDADDLPLNVGRDSLQANKSVKQIKRNLINKAIALLESYASSSDEDQQAKYAEFWKHGGSALKLGAHEDSKLRPKLMKLLRYESSFAESTSLSDYVSRRRVGQTQIYFAASAGGNAKELARSPFVERVLQRGYEVLWFLEPLDELLVGGVKEWDGLKFQDVAKKGLVFGDEDDKEKEEEEQFRTQFKALTDYFKKELSDSVSEVVISSRLTTSPCAVVTDQFAWTGNMQRMMAAQNNAREQDSIMNNYFGNAKKVLEINPRHPLIEGLLDKLEDVGEDDEDLRENVLTLWDTSMVRSGFALKDTNGYFNRVEAMLRKSLGVSSTATAVLGDIKAAPPIDHGPVRSAAPQDTPLNFGNAEEEDPLPKGDQWQDWAKIKDQIRDSGATSDHDEL